MPAYLFVYGTLMRGECRGAFLAGEEFIGEAETSPGYRLYDVGEFPALISAQRGVAISGELWLVGDDKLRELDDVEEVDEGLYARQAVQLRPPHESLPVETYVYRQSVSGLREVGASWRER